MGAASFLILLSAIFLVFVHASKLDVIAPIAHNLDCYNGTGHGCQGNYADSHLRRAVDAGKWRRQKNLINSDLHDLTLKFLLDERLSPLIKSLDIFPRSSGLAKRDGITFKKQLEFEPFDGDDKTYAGFISVDDIEGIKTGDGGASTQALVKAVAFDDYLSLSCEDDSPNLVAALYIPKLGVFAGSIPRSAKTAVKLFEMAQKYPDYSKVLNQRLGGASPDQMNNPEDQFHAEDMVIGRAISKMAEKNMDIEEGLMTSKITIWGVYGKGGKEGNKPPCGTTGDSKINPSCLLTLQILGIKHV